MSKHVKFNQNSWSKSLTCSLPKCLIVKDRGCTLQNPYRRIHHEIYFYVISIKSLEHLADCGPKSRRRVPMGWTAAGAGENTRSDEC
jgi:hypothetical protein